MSKRAQGQNCTPSRAELAPCLSSLATFLRRLHPRDTAQSVAADTGIPAASIENWLKGIAFPRAVHQFRLMAVYGPSALAAMMPSAPRWLDDAVRAERLRDLEAQSASLAAERAALEQHLGRAR